MLRGRLATTAYESAYRELTSRRGDFVRKKSALPCRQPSYLDALNDPLLPEDRRLALQLARTVHQCQRKRELTLSPADFSEKQHAHVHELRCMNCGKEFGQASLFCRDFCKQQAKLVRYVRKAISEKRIASPDVQEGIGIKLWLLTGEGYPTSERSVPEKRRKEIFERDRYTCSLCGRPADQMDHIAGNSDDPSNLRALCGECNRRGAFRNAREPTREEAKNFKSAFLDMAKRIAAPEPTLPCDDPERWDKSWRAIRNSRRERCRELEEEAEGEFEDIDGYLHAAMQKDD